MLTLKQRTKEIQCLNNYEEETAFYAVKDRAKVKDWYVLVYDMNTTEYKNEIVFKTFDEALDEFKQTEPKTTSERIELIFSPLEDDEEFGDNVVVKFKTL